jgi:hypothetical protein
MTRTGHIFLWAVAATLLLFCSRASAQCIRVVQAERELPFEVDTPQGNHLSYFYNLANEQYFVVATRGGAGGVPQGPFMLTRGCAPAKLEWESTEFVVLTAGCGTFCWYATALPVVPDVQGPRGAMRPLAFDAERNLLASYPDPGGVIHVQNLATGVEQDVRTPAQCPSSAETCFENLGFTPDALQYTWKFWWPLANGEFEYFPDELITVPLDTALTAR